MNFQDIMIRIVFGVVGLISGFFSLRMIVMFVFRTFEKRIESKKILQPLPYRPDIFFSILIPARNESAVIQKTLEHMCLIRFPRSQFDIIVITDAKEKSSNLEPSTKDMVIQFLSKLSKSKSPKITLLDVPEGFDGKMNGCVHPFPVRSTKGRALNYCLSRIHSKGKYHICSFFDAESHPDPSILLELASRISTEETPSVYQGPLFQVRNFWKISLFTKIVALTQAFSHEYSLPMILKWIPFLGGTNMHVSLDLMKEVNGFSNTTITEDLELGVRLGLLKNSKPKFIDIPSSEQTPCSIKDYFYQRSRWGGGNVDTLEQIHKMIQTAQDKTWRSKLEILFLKLSFYGPGEWILYFSVGLIFFFTYLNLVLYSLAKFLNFFYYSYHFYYYILISGLKIFITLPMVLSGLFILLLYFKYSSYIQDAWKPRHLLQLPLIFLFVITVVPFVAWLYAYPFIYACFSHWLGFSQRDWIKTVRTTEV